MPLPASQDLAPLRHGLRTPVNHILGYCELLAEEAAARGWTGLREDLRRVEDGARQILALVNYYFATTRPELPEALRRHVQHEIRTPVNHIIGYADILRETPELAAEESALRDLRGIREAALDVLQRLERALLYRTGTEPAPEGGIRLPPPPLAADPLDRPELTGVRVLVVDDHPVSLELLARQLGRHGCTVTTAGSGHEALRRLREGGPAAFDLALLDLVMPEMDGLELLTALKGDPVWSGLSVLMLSALDDTDMVIHAIRLGADDFVPKPVGTRLLLARLEASLARRRFRELRRRGGTFYWTGGSLEPDTPSYVERRADTELLDHLLAGELCYVITSRQMGKSSLVARTTARLRDRGVVVAKLDFSAGGQNLNAGQWYVGLATKLAWQLRLEDEIEDFWEAQARLGPAQRFFAVLRDVVLAQYRRPCVIFVDELDTVRSLPFAADEFFAAVREAYQNRSADPVLTQLTFCLLGVAPPTDLLRDPAATPFNIGHRIDLEDFTLAEARSLAAGLNRPPEEAAAMLERVLHWTGGHPYLTQRLCAAVATDASVHGAAGVDRLCARLLLSPAGREEDDNLSFARRMLLAEPDGRALALEAFRRIRQSPRGVRDGLVAEVLPRLRQAGLVRREGGRVRVRNRIYARVFDNAWLAAQQAAA